jgi:toxin ParE1/3/4
MYKLSRAAGQDIENLLTHSLAEFGLSQTEDYVSSLTRGLRLLAENPELGRPVDDIRPGYRRFPHKSHLIFYKTTGNNDILIIRILHSHMDAIRHIRD